MGWKESFRVDAAHDAAADRLLDSAQVSSRPAAEEGARAFFSVREPAARNAVIELATKLAALDHQRE